LNELKILNKKGAQIDMATHNVKKVFGGEIVKVINKNDV
jgi:hypothetical protein